MKSEETWKYIHHERGQLAETLSSLSSDQWARTVGQNLQLTR